MADEEKKNEESSDTESESTEKLDAVELDSSFTTETTALMTIDAYNQNLKDGLRVKDLRGILGMPHQFLPIADPRIINVYSDDMELNGLESLNALQSNLDVGEDDQFGRVYSEKIIKNIPLLLMTPGVPKFMSEYSKKQRNSMLNTFFSTFDATNYNLTEIFNGKNGKFYSLKFAYTEYYYYVNAMLRAAVFYLGIQNEKIDGKLLGTLNWMNESGTMANDTLYGDTFTKFLKPYANSVAFYVDAGTTVDDSFGNTTGESSLVESKLNTLSDTAREVNFLLGTISGEIGFKYDEVTEEMKSGLTSVGESIDKTLGKSGFFSSILNKGSSILAGGKLIFPEIWQDSSFSRSYSCNMKLVSPSGDKLSVFWNILVPIYHLLAFTLPREATDQAYFSPFLVRAYYKGLFNVDMGIIPGLSITKGDEGEWTIDGIPTVANVSFEIKDLYDGLYMSKQYKEGGAQGILSNTQELDYIANSCGVNVNDQDVLRTIKLAAAYLGTSITDSISIGIFGNISQFINQKMNNIFGTFK